MNSTLNAVHAQLEIQRTHVAKLLKADEEASTAKPFESIDIKTFGGSPEDIARAIRLTWLIPNGPLKNLTELIERRGGLVIACNFHTPLIDAISKHPPGMPPIFFINTANLTCDRYRYTLAHELGHMIMHSVPNMEMEEEADRFAAELLMPAEDIRSSLTGVTLPRLASLKQIWRVSMAALLKRAGDLRKVTERQARYLWMQMGKSGFRLREPVELDFPMEEGTRLRSLIDFHLGHLGYSTEQLASALCLHESECRETYMIKFHDRKLRLV